MPIESHEGFPRHSAAEMRRRHEALHELMDARGLQGVVVGGATSMLDNSVQYFTNWPPMDDSYAVFFRESDPVVVVRPWNHVPDAERISVVDDVRYGGISPEKEAATVGSVLAERCPHGGRFGLVGPVRHVHVRAIESVLDGVEWHDAAGWYRTLRLVKTAEELEYMRIAAAMADRSVEALEREIRPGVNERELAAIIEGAYLGLGGRNAIHYTLSTPMDDPRLCVPHQYQPDRTIRSGDVVATEISVSYWGYSGQILRTFTVDGGPETRTWARRVQRGQRVRPARRAYQLPELPTAPAGQARGSQGLSGSTAGDGEVKLVVCGGEATDAVDAVLPDVVLPVAADPPAVDDGGVVAACPGSVWSTAKSVPVVTVTCAPSVVGP